VMLGWAVIGAVLLGALAVPHRLPLRHVSPASASAVWLSVLVLRAVLALVTAIALVRFLPGIGAMQAVADWCLHTVIPMITGHVDLPAHPVADATSLLPLAVLTGSAAWALGKKLREAIALRRRLRRQAVCAGPLGTTLVEAHGFVVGVTEVGRPRVIISQDALDVMDREELVASVTHEIGHVRRLHRPILLLAAVLFGAARLLPGTIRARRELLFNLERDADRYAVSRTGNPLALASAICKAAARNTAPPNLLGLGGRDDVVHRLDYLVGRDPDRASRAAEPVAKVLAAVLACVSVGLALAITSWALGLQPGHVPVDGAVLCPH